MMYRGTPINIRSNLWRFSEKTIAILNLSSWTLYIHQYKYKSLRKKINFVEAKSALSNPD